MNTYSYILIQTSRSSLCSLPRADCDASLISSHGESDSQTQPEHYICRRKKNKRRQIFAVEGVDSICLCSPVLPELMHIELPTWFPITWIWVVSDCIDFPPRVLESERTEDMEDKTPVPVLFGSMNYYFHHDTFSTTRKQQNNIINLRKCAMLFKTYKMKCYYWQESETEESNPGSHYK